MENGVILAVIVGLSEFLKKKGLRTELIPLVNALIGIVANLALSGFNLDSALSGVITGLVASGVYDQTKICKLFKDNQ